MQIAIQHNTYNSDATTSSFLTMRLYALLNIIMTSTYPCGTDQPC